ncbi:MAG: hypothetical protein AB1798_17265, partial [Spirochaetota bacterium]
EAVFQSNDGGNYWQLYSLGLTTDSQADTEQYKSPHFRGLQVSNTFAKDKTIFLAGFDGLFKSIDGGHVWMAMQTLSPKRISGLSVSSGSKEHPTIAITTAGGGIYTTEDQGQTWLVHNKALNRADPMEIAISPNYHSDQTILFTSETDFGISKDNGQNWSITGFEGQENRIRSLARSAIYRLGLPIPTQLKPVKPKPDIIVFSPNYASDKTIFFGTRNDGVYQSVNGGQSWLAIWKGKKISSLVISPDFSSDKTLFVDDRDSGVYKTINSGKTWQHINNGLAFTKNMSLATLSTDLTRQDIKLVISPNYEIDQTAFAGSVEDLYKTIDGGASWQKLEVLPDEKHSFIIAMAVSPDYRNDQTIIVSVKGKGLFKSEDGGLNFVQIGSDLINNNYSLKWIKPSSS